MKRSIFAYNQKCLQVLSDKRIMSHLLKVTLEAYKDLTIEEIECLIGDCTEEKNILYFLEEMKW